MNGENAANGSGLTAKLADKLLAAGADVLTTGNHVWQRRDLYDVLERSARVIRPANLGGPDAPGRGLTIVETSGGEPVAVLNLQGALFLNVRVHPFAIVDELVEEARARTRSVFVLPRGGDEREDRAPWILDGRVTAWWEPTHVQTGNACPPRRDSGHHRRQDVQAATR